ncbi:MULTISPECIES: nitrilase-related carbon-nitrogen hydrolase [unclassified Lactobacillus]|uniref:nitrilase-related carbon-nitrogen hydrolase n=1 Tax=unclassified Lactobacillus TaxID=2620435 RepID=UPI0023F97A20|nr:MULTISPECIES: nitrilase-related carbon-nitrogen hydrolase [unclassified Lactobacillus]MDF7668844.1 hypothetical protein [Lactobacillus sp. ESL0703]WEV38461.1 hypothetical protein OZX58_06930 [Lactobacillus sp. ESL0680]
MLTTNYALPGYLNLVFMQAGARTPVSGYVSEASMNEWLRFKTDSQKAEVKEYLASKSATEIAEMQIQDNLDQLFEYMDRATISYAGYQMLITPETYTHGFSPVAHDYPLHENDKFMKQLQDKCATLGVWLVVGAYYQFEGDDEARNVAITINDEGKVVNIYAKAHPWNPAEPTHPGMGEGLMPFDGPEGSKISTIICADGDYHEMWDLPRQNGANLVIRISAYMDPYQEGTMITNHEAAYHNNFYVAYTNLAGRDDGYQWFGHSGLYAPGGELLQHSDSKDAEMFMATFNPREASYLQNSSMMGDLGYLNDHRGGANPNAGDHDYIGFKGLDSRKD